MKTKYLICLLILISLEFKLNLSAQTKLSGTVVDKSNHSLAGVNVDFSNGIVKTTTDIDGKFMLSYPDTLQNRRLTFRYFGFKVKNVSVNKGQESLKVVLLDSIYNIKGVTVSAPRNGRFSDYSAQTIKMSVIDIGTNPAALGDIIGGMRVLPGVQTNDNDGRLIIQGGSPDESQIYINDLIVSNPYALSSKNSAGRTRFSPDLFSGVVLQSGGFNAEFGQALSGIVNLNTIDRDEMTAKTDISVSSIFTGLTHIDKKPSYAYRASAGYSNLFLTEKLIGSEYDWKKPFQGINTDLFLTKELSSVTQLTAQFNGSYSGGIYSGMNIDSVKFESHVEQTYLYGQINFYHTFNKLFSLSVASNMIAEKTSGTGAQFPGDKFVTESIWNHNKITLQYKSGRITNRTGAEWMNHLACVYNDTKMFLSNNFTVSAGLRGEYSVYLKKANIAPRLYLAYQPATGNIFSLTWGDYFRLPSTDDMKMTDNLDFVSVRKLSASYSYVKNAGKFQLDTYYKKYRNLVTFTQEGTTDHSGTGTGYGADLFWKSNFKSLEYWLTYSFNHTRKKYEAFPEAIAPPYVAAHSLNLTLKYWIAPLQSMLSAGSFVSSGSPYYSPLFPYTKSGVTPYHSRLDVSWSYLPKPWIILHFGFQNVLGRKNIYGYEYSETIPDRRRAITASNDRYVFVGAFITISRNKKLNQLKSL